MSAVAPTGPASASGLAFTFPIVGRTGDAVIQHVGGLSLTAGETVVTLSNFWIDTDSGVVTGVVDDTVRVPLFTLGAATDDGLALELTEVAADYLNGAFGVDVVQRGPGHRLRRARRERLATRAAPRPHRHDRQVSGGAGGAGPRHAAG